MHTAETEKNYGSDVTHHWEDGVALLPAQGRDWQEGTRASVAAHTRNSGQKYKCSLQVPQFIPRNGEFPHICTPFSTDTSTCRTARVSTVESQSPVPRAYAQAIPHSRASHAGTQSYAILYQGSQSRADCDHKYKYAYKIFYRLYKTNVLVHLQFCKNRAKFTEGINNYIYFIFKMLMKNEIVICS